MKWLKWHHKFSSGGRQWEWLPIDDDTDTDSARDIVAELAESYSYSEHYRGIDYEIVDHAPRWVVEQKLREAGGRILVAENEIRDYTELLTRTRECVQCEGATVATDEHYRQYGTGVTIQPCPSCGHCIMIETMRFWLMPSDVDAIKLLGALVENGPRSVKSKTFRWPVEKGDEEDAYNRLSKLGLVGGSSYQDVREIRATDRGKAEWAKHKDKKP